MENNNNGRPLDIVMKNIMDSFSKEEINNVLQALGYQEFADTKNETLETMNQALDEIEEKYGDDSVEYEATEEFADEVEEDLDGLDADFYKQVGEQLHDTQEHEQEYPTFLTAEEMIRLATDEIEPEPKVAKIEVTPTVKKAVDLIKNTANKIKTNVLQFYHDAQHNVLKAVDKARVAEKQIMNEYDKCRVADISVVRDRHLAKAKHYEDLANKVAVSKVAVKNVFRTMFKKSNVDLNEVKAKTGLYINCKNWHLEKAIEYDKLAMEKAAKIKEVATEIRDIRTKWQDKGKEPTAASFNKHLNEVEREAAREAASAPRNEKAKDVEH